MTLKEKSVERAEHFIDTESGMRIYALEKKLSDSSPEKAVLLIHGVGVGHACWDMQMKDYSMMELLARGGIDVFAVDQRGYGKSTRPDGLTITCEACAGDLVSVVDFIRELRHVEKVDIVGHSFGGMVAVCLAGKCAEHIGKIVLMGYAYKELHPDFQPVVDEIVKLAKAGVPYAPNDHYLNPEEYIYSYEPEVLASYKELIGSYPEWPTGIFLDLAFMKHGRYIPGITAPTLLINGALEEVVTPGDALKCLNDLGAGEKALLVVGNAYHCIWLEKAVHRMVYEAVLGWLNSPRGTKAG